MISRVSPARLATIVVGAALLGGVAGAPALRVLCAQQAVETRPVVLDVVALDANGRPMDGLGPGDFAVTIDGENRPVLAVRHVSRGPGAAADATALAARAPSGVRYAAEPARTIFVLIDQETLGRGDERPVVRAAAALLDRLGLADRVAVVALPLAAQTSIALDTDRPALREALASVTGQRTRQMAGDQATMRMDRSADLDPNRDVNGDPDRNAAAQQVSEQPALSSERDAHNNPGSRSLAALRQLLTSLGAVPGRKAVVLVSAGVPPAGAGANDIEGLARAALAAHSVVYALEAGTRARFDDLPAPDFAPLRALAGLTGGFSAAIDRNPERGIERLLADLSFCYVLEVEGGSSDADGRHHAVKVASAHAATLRTASVLVARPDAEDMPVESAAGTTPAPPSLDRPDRKAEPSKDREARVETAAVLSRASDYLDAYQQAFSAIVAEEVYEQRAGPERVRLRSDFLLVKTTDGGRWVSFRDVFEVDGNPVRDRDDRLKRLFLEAGGGAGEQLEAIKADSARYNIGPVQRNVNVPLYALIVLRSENRGRFAFSATKKGQVDGLPTWRLEFQETASPTLVMNPSTGKDLPLEGYFLIEADTGAIVTTSMTLRDSAGAGEFTVRFHRDEKLGLWVPAEMAETYTNASRGTVAMRARATYSNLRRFQVKTDVTISR